MAKKKKRPDEDDVKPKKKARTRAVEDDEDDDSGGEPESDRPKNDVYVGLGVITLIALIAGATLLYLDHDANNKKQPPSATVSVADLKLSK